jgi:glutathione S-transferase
MIELIQFPWSPYCLVQKRILEFARTRFTVVNIPVNDRSRVWRMTRQRYYQVPVLRDGRNVVFETSDNSQVIAKYLDDKLGLGLFLPRFEGVQSLIWHHIENEVEGFTFRLNDVHWREVVPRADWLGYLRHKERRFGRGCLEAWAAEKDSLLEGLTRVLRPYEDMLLAHPFLLDERPRFVDFDLHGMLANFLYSGHYTLPAALPRLGEWHRRMKSI